MLKTTALKLIRLPGEDVTYPEQKDPSIIEKHPDDATAPYRFIKYTSSGRSDTQAWKVARFGANDLEGQWQELQSPTLKGLSGPQLCAPALAYEFENGKPHYIMYIQTACFEPNGVIMEAHSEDGKHFVGKQAPLITRDSITKPKCPLLGVYDPSYSQVKVNGRMHDCLTFTGITKMELAWPHKTEGDIYMSLRERAVPNAQWSDPRLVLDMSKIPFHNQPNRTDHEYEWCPEGTQIVGIDEKHFLMIGVCFMQKPSGCDGERQRVFFAASRSVDSPFIPMGMPFEPQAAKGETGHPDTVFDHQNRVLHVFLQEREGNFKPWTLRQSKIDISFLRSVMDDCLNHNEQQGRAAGVLETGGYNLGTGRELAGLVDLAPVTAGFGLETRDAGRSL